MADWSSPIVTTGYAATLTGLKDRDVDSATMFNNGTPTNTPTGAIKLDAASTTSTLQRWSGTAWADAVTTWYTPALSVSGDASFGQIVQTGTGVTTGSAALEVGGLRSGSGPCYIDIHTTAGTDWEARISRGSGANGSLNLYNSGTGGISITQTGAAPISLSTTNLERMRVDADGNVLIGATTPSRNASGRALLELTGSSNAMVAFRSGASESGYLQGSGANMYLYSTGWNRLQAETGTLWTIGTSTEVMRLNASGNLGIGTTAPGGRLDVKGGVALINAYSGTTTAPSESQGPLTPALTVNVYGTGASRLAQAWSMPADPVSFSDNSQWNIRLWQTANSTTSSGITGATFAGPGFLALGAGAAERMRITAAGNVGIGKTAPTVALDVVGAITATGDITAYSDARLKTNIVQISSALDRVRGLQGVTFDRIDTGERGTGLIAQHVQSVLPEAVRDDGENLSVNYGALVGLLVEAIKELAA